MFYRELAESGQLLGESNPISLPTLCCVLGVAGVCRLATIATQ